MIKNIFLVIFVVLATVRISTAFHSDVDFEGNDQGHWKPDWDIENETPSSENLDYKKKLAEEVDRTAVSRVKENLDNDHDNVYNTVKCARCIKRNVFNYKRTCGTECYPILRDVEYDFSGDDHKSVCRECLYKAVTKNTLDCTYQCTTQDLNKVLYGLLKQY